ncbi:hypothetical protein VIGAN_UM157700 [Vigna angularis var. angularis]|uniref:Uncharacterized protein n=1 Tax=Vigna angularis var. angularis TaxID=157739 RepID=A0A0S3TEZ0_PHAAN|nr:hypothetical protein VIGAN_UM157700 [Vigna angularis var. angularis]
MEAPLGGSRSEPERDKSTASPSSSPISVEEEAEIVDRTKQSKAGKGPVKSKNAKSPSPTSVHASSIKKKKDGKSEEVAL